MNFVTNYFENPIVIEENVVNVIVIENTTYFSKFILELNDDIFNGTKNFYISNKLAELNLSKIATIITDLFNFSVNKVAISKILKLIEINFNDDAIKQQQLKEINCLIFKFLDDIIFDLNVDLKIDEEFTISSLLKMANLKVDEEQDNLFNRIINFIKIIGNLDLFKIIFFVNLKTFLTDEQLLEIYKIANYTKINLVLIENKIYNKLNFEKYYILDNDLCEYI